MSNKTTRRGGVGFFGMLTILFIGLKLGNIIDWNWWWVLSPLWIPTVISIVFFIFIGILAAITNR